MQMENIQYLDKYEESLRSALLKQSASRGFLGGELLQVEELDDMWRESAPEYMVDAVAEINNYPSVAVGWALFFGMGLAGLWDDDWSSYKAQKNIYRLIADHKGFDVMDEYISEDILRFDLQSKEYNELEDMIRSLASTAISTIRREQIEAGTATAFHIFARSAKVMFQIGVSIELKRRGYKYEKLLLDVPKE